MTAYPVTDPRRWSTFAIPIQARRRIVYRLFRTPIHPHRVRFQSRAYAHGVSRPSERASPSRGMSERVRRELLMLL